MWLTPDPVCALCLQVQLYEDFAKSRAKVGVEDTISLASQEEEEKPKLKATGHVFQVLTLTLTHVHSAALNSASFHLL